MNRVLVPGRRAVLLASLCLVLFSRTALAADSSAKSAKEAAAVERVIRAAAQALSDYPKTLDADSVLSYYATGFVGIENGEETTLQDQRDLLADLSDQLASGTHVGLSFRTASIRVRVIGALAIATYDYTFRIGVAGQFADEEAGKCTSILERSGAKWLFRHEHCSSVCPPCDDELEEEEDSATPNQT